MLRITSDDLLAYAIRLNGTQLQTLYNGRPFKVDFRSETIVFTPQSTGKPRPHERKYLDRVCKAFNKTNSLKPADYRDGTYNASYTLTLIAKYLGAIAGGEVSPAGGRPLKNLPNE